MENKKKYQKIEKLSDEEIEKALKSFPRPSEFVVFNETDLDYSAIGKAIEGIYKHIVSNEECLTSAKNGEERCYDLTFRIGKDSMVEYKISCGINLTGTPFKFVYRIEKNRDLTKYEVTRKIGTPDFVKKGFGEIQ